MDIFIVCGCVRTVRYGTVRMHVVCAAAQNTFSALHQFVGVNLLRKDVLKTGTGVHAKDH